MGHPLTDVYASCITTGAKHDASLTCPPGLQIACPRHEQRPDLWYGAARLNMTRTHTYGRGELYTLFDFLQNYENIAINQNNSSRIEK